MESFYFNLKRLNNSWFVNSKNVKILSGNSEWETLIPDMGIGILVEAPRETYTNVCGWCSALKYQWYSFTIEGRDHCNARVKYTFILGVSDFGGRTDSMKTGAFRLLQRILMKEEIGVLKKEAVNDLLLIKEEEARRI